MLHHHVFQAALPIRVEPPLPRAMTASPQFAERLSPDFRCARTGYLRAPVRTWCEAHLSDFVEKLTGVESLPVAVYFASEAERARFIRAWA